MRHKGHKRRRRFQGTKFSPLGLVENNQTSGLRSHHRSRIAQTALSRAEQASITSCAMWGISCGMRGHAIRRCNMFPTTAAGVPVLKGRTTYQEFEGNPVEGNPVERPPVDRCVVFKPEHYFRGRVVWCPNDGVGPAKWIAASLAEFTATGRIVLRYAFLHPRVHFCRDQIQTRQSRPV